MRSYIVRYMYSIITGGNLTMNSTTTNDNLKKMVTAALLAALTCAATMSVRIPTLGTGGYIHPGDALVILCGIILGPSWGFLAGGIGSTLADLLGGYFIYVPITLAIKGLVALSSRYSLPAYEKIFQKSLPVCNSWRYSRYHPGSRRIFFMRIHNVRCGRSFRKCPR